MRVLVVDDEPIARRRLIRMLERIGGVTVVGEAEDGEDALAKIDALAPDLLLLDIRMPGLDGLQLARRTALPPVIFTTAHADHALEAFEAAAVDYLLKPITVDRLTEALERARRRTISFDAGRLAQVLASATVAAKRPPRLIARRGDSSWLIDPREVSRLQANDKYVVITRDGKELVLDESLSELEEKLSPYGFCRIHRGEIVNLESVRAVHRPLGELVLELQSGERVRVSRRRAAEVLQRLGM